MTDKEKRFKRYMEKQRHRARKKRMAKELTRYPVPYEIVDDRYVGDGRWEKIKKPYVRAAYKSSNCERYKYYKKLSNRKVRRTDKPIANVNGYRRVFDYSWEVY